MIKTPADPMQRACEIVEKLLDFFQVDLNKNSKIENLIAENKRMREASETIANKRIPDQPFKLMDRVQKRKGYSFPGIIVCSYWTLSGEPRYIVECTAEGAQGCQHIFAPEQLEAIPPIDSAYAARAVILARLKEVGRAEILKELVAWNNTTDNDINEEGDVWVCDPQKGHWLEDDRIIEFARHIA